ncbi:saxiphilin-like isoform X2 [Hyperolius riggenbachi]|uniref:saxiphilin-like isoform X2 n=1 Tax=Hyperolius riggenbachi TaxID=752182 RepID=UPI0035A2E90E
MAPTFHIAFCLTIIGVGFAAPSAANVRWCVISDLEQKKCNDLVASCNVPQMSLVCVHKSSTEDCMAAVANGEADAVFLDSGEVCKASMTPYNLKPILSESHGSHEDTPPCRRARQRLLEDTKPIKGAYVPDCDDKGFYKPKQCHPSTGICMCVDAIGGEIKGTRTQPGQTPPTCEASEITKCLRQRQEALGDGHPAPGSFIHQCDEKGNFKSRQCHSSTGYCWCVNSDGNEIPNTKVPRGGTPPSCGVSATELTKCQKAHQEALRVQQPIIIGHIPDCDEKGNYKPMQRSGSSGYSWCVNADGEKIDGTDTPPGKPQPNCASHELTKCQKARQEALRVQQQPMIVGHIPDCDEKGNYKPMQRSESSGYSWCVNADGEKIDVTDTPPGKPQPNCASHELTKCQKAHQEALRVQQQPMIIGHVPDCDEKGNYKPMQRSGSSGYIWCVNADGEKIDGTDTPPGKPQPNCASHDYTPCLKERQRVLGTGNAKPLIGAYAPQCDDKGNYTPKQCHPSTGQCWCVDAHGAEISGTRTTAGQPPQTCGASDDTPCLKERQRVFGGKKPLIGAFAPQCDDKGIYKPKQCHASTGNCWCVDAHGVEIAGTRTSPVQTPPTCGAADSISDTCHYAVAIVKKSSTFQFDQLKGKKSCHSGVSRTAGWIVPIDMLVDKKLLSWEGPVKEPIQKAASRFFSLSCAPGAKEANLCKLCAGKGEKNCKNSQDEPYHGDSGAFRCLKEDKGEVAFVESTALSGEESDTYELLCPDNTRKPISQYKECNLGKIPSSAVVTRSSDDKTKDIIHFLQEAQKNQCKLFSSVHGKDLMFEDSTTSLSPLPAEVDTFFFVGAKWFNAIKSMTVEVQLPAKNKVRWCAINKAEKAKCDDWSAVSGGAIACTEASSKEKCIEQILRGEADAVTVDLQHAYTALQCGLTVALEEYHNKDDLGPCKGAAIKDFGEKRAVAVVKKSNKDINLNSLKGKKSCHTGVGDIPGWIIPVNLARKESGSCDIGTFFSESCAPGSDPKSKLCSLCVGDPSNPTADTRCSLSDKEAYHGNAGAIRCLVEKGDVAFVPHTAIFENTDGKNSADWAKDLKSSDFELLCPDGSRAPVSNYKDCKIAGLWSGTIVTREESVTDVVRIMLNQHSLFGKKGFEKDMFQLFSSTKGQHLLFRDDTECFYEFDRQPKNIMEDLFGKPYRTVVLSPNTCFKQTGGLISACNFKHC